MVGTARAQAAAEWPPRPQQCRWPRRTLAGGPRLAAGRVPDVLMFPHVPVAAAWGTLWARTHKTRACRGPNPVTSARPPTSVPGPSAASGTERGAGCACEHVGPRGGAGRIPAPASAPGLRCVPRPRVAPAAHLPQPEVRAACPGAQALQSGAWAALPSRGVLARVWTARAILDPSTRVPVAGPRPPGPAAVDPGPATQTSAPRPARCRGWLGLQPLPLSRSGVLLGLGLGLASWPAVRELCPLVRAGASRPRLASLSRPLLHLASAGAALSSALPVAPG